MSDPRSNRPRSARARVRPEAFLTRRTFLRLVGASSAFRLVTISGCSCSPRKKGQGGPSAQH
jgi:hypothetical protein